MKIHTSITGFIAFFIVLLTMPLGHAAMILMEKGFGHEYVYIAALLLGLTGVVMLIGGIASQKQTTATFLGLFGGLFVWTGWIEFSFVYYATRYGVSPLMENGEIITKPEYLIMPSSVGFWAVFMLYYILGSKSGCHFMNWIQRTARIPHIAQLKPTPRNTALTTFIELILLLWTFYLVLLFTYDTHFVGDRHPVTYFVAFASLFWAVILFIRLLRIKDLGYAIRYAIPTVIIFWNFIEILGRWNFFEEFWIHPTKYWVESLLLLVVFLILLFFTFIRKRILSTFL